MNYIIALLITAVSFGQVVPIASDSRPKKAADSRPSEWLATKSEELAAAGIAANEARGETLNLYLYGSTGTYYEKKEHLNKRSDSFKTLLSRVQKCADIEKDIIAWVLAGKDNSHGWVDVGGGVEIKMLTGWYEPKRTSKEELITNKQIDVDSMKFFRDECFAKFKQPVLLRADPKKVDAYKFTIVFTDKFGQPIVSGDIRRDSITEEVEITSLCVKNSDDKDKVVERLRARMASKKSELPFTIVSFEVVAKE